MIGTVPPTRLRECVPVIWDTTMPKRRPVGNDAVIHGSRNESQRTILSRS